MSWLKRRHKCSPPATEAAGEFYFCYECGCISQSKWVHVEDLVDVMGLADIGYDVIVWEPR